MSMEGKEILTLLSSQQLCRVAVMRSLRLGDLLCATPALRSLRAALPRAHITLIGLPLAREFVRRCRFLDDFEEFPGFPGIADQSIVPQRTVAFLARMQANPYDLAIQLHGSGVFSNPFTVLFGARYTVGFTRPHEAELGLDFSTPYPSRGREVHRLLTLMHALGAPNCGEQTELTVLPEDRAELQALLGDVLTTKQPLIALHPGAKVATRRWPLDRFAAIGDYLSKEYDAQILLTGGKEEEFMCERVRSLMQRPALNLAGQTSLGTLAALIERLNLFISNDSGPAHVAAALDTPSITIFGAANVEDWAASDIERHRSLSVEVPCRPCSLSECPIGYACLQGVTVDMVLDNAAILLERWTPKLETVNEI
jgi:ADP-heptose:LPS heptosyltransferase